MFRQLNFVSGVALVLLVSGALAQAQPSPERDARIQEFRDAWAQLGVQDYAAPEVRMLEATGVKRFSALEAGQGAAATTSHFFAIVNYVIGKYDKESGDLVDRWVGERGGLIAHLNSCRVERGELQCANSNHPEVPMASSIEVFDTQTLDHKRSKSLGLTEEGSLVWFDRFQEGWLAGFANYNDETGLPYKPNTFSGVVLYDANWRRIGGYGFPMSLFDKMAPQAASGGAIGQDGKLYIMGHDLPEMYVLEFPRMGPKLVHVATIAVPSAGQAFAFDPDNARRVWAINRPTREVITYVLPEISP